MDHPKCIWALCRLVDQAADLSPDQCLDHRIGIHLGDIVVSEQDVMGNGINISAPDSGPLSTSIRVSPGIV